MLFKYTPTFSIELLIVGSIVCCFWAYEISLHIPTIFSMTYIEVSELENFEIEDSIETSFAIPHEMHLIKLTVIMTISSDSKCGLVRHIYYRWRYLKGQECINTHNLELQISYRLCIRS